MYLVLSHPIPYHPIQFPPHVQIPDHPWQQNPTLIPISSPPLSYITPLPPLRTLISFFILFYFAFPQAVCSSSSKNLSISLPSLVLSSDRQKRLLHPQNSNRLQKSQAQSQLSFSPGKEKKESTHLQPIVTLTPYSATLQPSCSRGAYTRQHPSNNFFVESPTSTPRSPNNAQQAFETDSPQSQSTYNTSLPRPVPRRNTRLQRHRPVVRSCQQLYHPYPRINPRTIHSQA